MRTYRNVGELARLRPVRPSWRSYLLCPFGVHEFSVSSPVIWDHELVGGCSYREECAHCLVERVR